MKVTWIVFLCLATVVMGSKAMAAEKIGEISCNVISAEDLSVAADVYGEMTEDGAEATHIDLKLNSYDSTTKKNKILRTWANVPASDQLSLAMVFKNSEVRLEVWGDDVGAMSELRYEAQVLQLQCDAEFAE